MKNNNNQGALCFLDILGLVFIVLKLCGIIEWSWFWVLSPFILQLLTLLILVGITILCVIITSIKEKVKKRGK